MCGLESFIRIFEDDALGGGHSDPTRGLQVDVGSRLAMLDLIRGDDVIEERQQASGFKGRLHILEMPVRSDRHGHLAVMCAGNVRHDGDLLRAVEITEEDRSVAPGQI